MMLKIKGREGQRFYVEYFEGGPNKEIAFVVFDSKDSKIAFKYSLKTDLMTYMKVCSIEKDKNIVKILKNYVLQRIYKKMENQDFRDEVEEFSSSDIYAIIDNQYFLKPDKLFTLSQRIKEDILFCLYSKLDKGASSKEIVDYVWCDSQLLEMEMFHLEQNDLISSPRFSLKELEDGGKHTPENINTLACLTVKGRSEVERRLKQLQGDEIKQMAKVSEQIKEELDDKLPIFKYSFLEKKAQSMLNSCIVAGLPFGLIMIDIDNFKKFNFDFGVLIGDDVLKIVACKIREIVGVKGSVVRYGGEEIVVLLPNYNSDEIGILAERIRCEIEKYPFKIVHKDGTKAVQISLSMGITSTFKQAEYKKLIEEADTAMRKSKVSGKNKVTKYNNEE